MAMTLQQTRLRLTQAIYFGKPNVAVGSGFVRTNGTTPLTANWNAGNFAITSKNSEDCIQAAAYGVVANGSLTVSATGTDQTANMIAALTAAVTAGKKLRLPAGIIKFTQNVNIPEVFGTTTWVHINIEGAGSPSLGTPPAIASAQAGGTILKFWTGAGVHAITLSPGNNLAAFTLSNMEIQGPDNDTTTTSGDGVRIASAFSFFVRPFFQNIDINHFGGGAGYRLGSAAFQGPEDGSFINCTASYDDVGFSFNNQSNAHTLVNVGAQWCHSRGMEILDSVTISAYGGLLQTNDKTGLYIGGSVVGSPGQIHLSSFHVENNNTTSTAGMHGIHVLATNASGNCSFITFENCRFAVANDNVWLDTTGAAVIVNVSFIGCHQNPGALITINTAAVLNTVLFQSGSPLTDNGTATSIISDTITGNMTLGGNVLVKGKLQANGNIGAGGNPGTSALDVTAGTFRLSGNGVLSGAGPVEMANVAGFGLSTASAMYGFYAANGVTNYWTVVPGPLFGIGNTLPTRTLDLNGTQRWRGIAAPAVSEANSGTIYFDSGTNKLRASLNGAAYVDVIGSAGLTGSGVAGKLAYWTSATNVTDEPNITLGGTYTLDVNGDINLSATGLIRSNAIPIFGTNIANGILWAGDTGPPIGNNSTSFGHQALLSGTGIDNTAVGSLAGRLVAAGTDNTAVGFNALNQTTTGSHNTVIGQLAGATNTTGSNNVCLGDIADVGAGNLTNAVAIGYQAVVAANDSMELGNAAMKVGIRAGGTPHTALDVGGQVSHRMGTKAVVNGLNSDIATPDTSYLRLTGPSAVFSVGGFTGGFDGNILTIYCTVAFAMTIVNEDGSSTAINRIKTLTGGNVTLRAGTSAATFQYDTTDDRWVLLNSN